MKRLDFLDGLRGVAILLVIAGHIGSHTDQIGLLRYWSRFGSHGVQLFFVISAVTIMMTLQSGLLKSDRPFRDFYAKRFVRIASVYYAGILIYLAFYGMESRGWSDGPHPFDFLINLLGLNVVVPGVRSTVVPGGWSISLEVLFYTIAPIVFLKISGIRGALIAAIALTVVGLAILRYAPYRGPDLHLDLSLRRQFWFQSPLVQFAFFFYGILTYRVIQLLGARTKMGVVPQYLCLAIACGALTAIWGLRPVAQTHLITAVFCVIILISAHSERPLVAHPVLRFWGRVSFSAYILHFLIINLIAQPFYRGIENGPARLLVCALITLPITLAAAYVMFRVIELPAQRAIKRRLARTQDGLVSGSK